MKNISLTRLFDHPILRSSITRWVMSVLVSFLLHFVLKFMVTTLFKSRIYDIETYICCTNAFTETKDIGVGLMLLIFMNLFFLFFRDKIDLVPLVKRAKKSFHVSSSPHLLIITRALNILITLWMCNYWFNIIEDFRARQVLTSGNEIIPTNLILVLLLQAIFTGYILIIEPIQTFALKTAKKYPQRYQDSESSYNLRLLRSGVYILSIIRTSVYVFVFSLFGWLVMTSLGDMTTNFIPTTLLFIFSSFMLILNRQMPNKE